MYKHRRGRRVGPLEQEGCSSSWEFRDRVCDPPPPQLETDSGRNLSPNARRQSSVSFHTEKLHICKIFHFINESMSFQQNVSSAEDQSLHNL
jgi:hypothetical protein